MCQEIAGMNERTKLQCSAVAMELLSNADHLQNLQEMKEMKGVVPRNAD
jgi:hypothetical protein